MIDDTNNGGIELRPESDKPAKRAERGGGRRKPQGPNEAIGRVAAESGREIQAFRDEVTGGIAAYVDFTADEILADIADAPNKVVGALIEKAGGYAGDAEAFRDRGKEFAKALFPVVGKG